MIQRLAAFVVNRFFYPTAPERIVALEERVGELTDKLNEVVDAVNEIKGGAYQ